MTPFSRKPKRRQGATRVDRSSEQRQKRQRQAQFVSQDDYQKEQMQHARLQPDKGKSDSGPMPRIQSYLLHHATTFVSSLGQLIRNPVSSGTTIAVIAIAVTLPAILFALVNNVQQLTRGWVDVNQISVFMKTGIRAERIAQVKEQLGLWSDIGAITVIDPDQAMAEFRQNSGFGGSLDLLDSNPLPWVLTVTPRMGQDDVEQLERLKRRLAGLPAVERVQMDMQWLQRLQGFIAIGERGVQLLALLLGLAILLIVGNTIRLEVQNRRDEIIVTKLIGATNAFIRRPFLYSGFWYGLFGGISAYLLISLALSILGGPFSSWLLYITAVFFYKG